LLVAPLRAKKIFARSGTPERHPEALAMCKKFAYALLAWTIVIGLGLASSRPAEARRNGGGIVAGVAVGTLLGLGIAGAYAGPRYYYGPAGYGPGCYAGPRQCGWSGRSCWRDAYGETICRGGDWRCWRPTVCN
jgi:hypothetical protein